jgi:hypothetical protein
MKVKDFRKLLAKYDDELEVVAYGQVIDDYSEPEIVEWRGVLQIEGH